MRRTPVVDRSVNCVDVREARLRGTPLSPEAAAHAKEWELALLLVRLFRSLDALWGHEEAARTWLTTDNLALSARPVDLIPSVEGLVRVVNYLDNARGRL